MKPFYEDIDWDNYKLYFEDQLNEYLELSFKICREKKFEILNYKNFIKKNLFYYLSEFIFCEYLIKNKIYWPEYLEKEYEKHKYIALIPKIKIPLCIFKKEKIDFGFMHRFSHLTKNLNFDYKIENIEFNNILKNNSFNYIYEFQLADLDNIKYKLNKLLTFLNINYEIYKEIRCNVKTIYSSCHKMLNPIFLFFTTFLQEIKNAKVILSQAGLFHGTIRYSHVAELENLIADEYFSWGESYNHKNYKLVGSQYFNRKLTLNKNYCEQIYLNDIPLKNYPTPLSEISSMSYLQFMEYFKKYDYQIIQEILPQCKKPLLKSKHVSYSFYKKILKDHKILKLLGTSNVDLEATYCDRNFLMYYSTAMIELYNAQSAQIIPVYNENSITLHESEAKKLKNIFTEKDYNKKDLAIKKYVNDNFKVLSLDNI